MYYSAIGILALLILIITNYDVILKRKGEYEFSTQKIYRLFIFSIMAYYITDILWGLFDALSLRVLLFIDTEIYFAAMASGILFWTRYVISYLNEKNVFSTFLRYAGTAFFAFVTLSVTVNVFYPVVFHIGEDGSYNTLPVRYVILITQIVLLLLSAVYALYVTAHTKGVKRNRHLTIGLFGLIMLVFISIQVFYPLLPLYAMGYMLGSCLLRTFVIENENAGYRADLETSLKREKKQLKELKTAWNAAYTDALTGAKSKLAYVEKEEQIDAEIANGSMGNIAIAVFDVNELKHINDTKGHDTGDEYIKSAFKIICECFDHSPVYRIGGDEFVAILEGEDYENREKLKDDFNKMIEGNLINDKVVVSLGTAEYIFGHDNSCKRIFQRADQLMYARKDDLKLRKARLI